MEIREKVRKTIKEVLLGIYLGEESVTILNTAILTNYGIFRYTPISLEEGKKLIANGFTSAVGHQSTCDVISKLLGVDVKMNRMEYSQGVGQTALVFKLKGRPTEEGQILTVADIEKIGYEFGKLERLE